MKTMRSGFTLVELSIVLVIIGLLVGGVLTGQSLIRAAELRSVTSQYQRYTAAVMTFRDKYFALPGDMTNATAYWGAADGSTGNTTACMTTASTTAVTCNGNGDGFINNPTNSYEYFRFWQHLANAGLIEGNYSGIGTSATAANLTNVPPSRISGTLWYINNSATQSGSSNVFDGTYNNTFILGGQQSNGIPNAPVFKAEDSYNIDTKLDDGLPGAGKVVMYSYLGFTGTACTTATASSQLTATYVLTNSTPACAIMFRQQF